MKRPLLVMGGSMVLGEVLYILMENNFHGAMFLLIVFITCEILYFIISIRYSDVLKIVISKIESNKTAQKKCSDLLLFLFLINLFMTFGYLWGYGYYEEERENVTELESSAFDENEYVDVRNSAKSVETEKELSGKETGNGESVYGESKDGGEAYGEPKDGKSVYGESGDCEGNMYITQEDVYIERVETVTYGKRVILKTKAGKMLMYIKEEADLLNDLETGKYIILKGHLSKLQGATNPGAMDMEKYYSGKGIRYQVEPDYIEIRKDKVNHLSHFLYKIRMRLRENLELWFGEDAALLSTMLLGDRDGLGNDTKLLFQRSGIAHILAISGLHVALIAGIVEKLLSKLKIRKQISMALVIAFLWLYGLMTGFSEATVRAVLMLTVSRLAFIFKRSPDMPTAMMEALLIMALFRPDSLMATGMWMSFVAVVGVVTGNAFYDLIYGKKGFDDLSQRMKYRLRGWMKGLFISVSISLWMLPLIIYSNYEVPMLALILNMLVIPLLTVLVSLGMVVAVFGGVFYIAWLIKGVVFICRLIIAFYKLMCGLLLSIPGAVIVTGHIEGWLLAFQYVVIAGACWLCWLIFRGRLSKAGFRAVLEKLFMRYMFGRGRFHRRKWKISKWFSDKSSRSTRMSNGDGGKSASQIKRTVAFISGCLVIFLINVFGVKLYNSCCNQVVFLDVGQGDGSIIHVDGRNYIVDCGSTSSDSVGQYVLIPALKYYGMSDIECVFISHTDTDHINGIIYLLENGDRYGIKVRSIALAKGTEVDENCEELLRAFLKDDSVYPEQGEASINGQNNVIGLSEGDMVDGKWEVLYPGLEEEGDHSGNDYSLVLRFRYRDIEILYTGDIGSEVEEKLVERGVLGEEKAVKREQSGKEDNHIRILKCPHHGSKYSGSSDFLSEYAPDITIISVANSNLYGHPAAETIERINEAGSNIYRTDQNGAMIIGDKGTGTLSH